MEPEFHDLCYVVVLLVAVLTLPNVGVSMVLRLGLSRRLTVASCRTVIQLMIVGFVLQWVFTRMPLPGVLVLMLAMSVAAGISGVRRVGRRFRGIWLNGILAVAGSGWLITAIALMGIIQPHVWRDQSAQDAVAFRGMWLGHRLKSSSLPLGRFTEKLATQREQVELRLTLGATRWEAAHELIQDAIRTGMIPIINTMSDVGIVNLPGMMTGQLLAGAAPSAAVKYQIVIIFMIAATTALGTTTTVLLSYRSLFSREHQFLADRIHRVRQA